MGPWDNLLPLLQPLKEGQGSLQIWGHSTRVGWGHALALAYLYHFGSVFWGDHSSDFLSLLGRWSGSTIYLINPPQIQLKEKSKKKKAVVFILKLLQAPNIHLKAWQKRRVQLSASLTNEASHSSVFPHQTPLPKRDRSSSGGQKKAIFELCSLCMLMKLSRGCDLFILSLVEMQPARGTQCTWVDKRWKHVGEVNGCTRAHLSPLPRGEKVATAPPANNPP